MATFADIHQTCGTCYAGQNKTCDSRYCQNRQTERCVAEYKRRQSS